MRNLHLSRTGIAALLTVLVAGGVSGTVALRAAAGPRGMTAPACEGNDELFPRRIAQVQIPETTDDDEEETENSEESTLPDSLVTAWSQSFNGQMDRLIEAHLRQIQVPARCDGSIRIPPSDELRDLAQKLPEWKESDALENLSESDMPVVALAYLRSYECTLKEREQAVLVNTYGTTMYDQPDSETGEDGTGNPEDRGIPVISLLAATSNEQDLIVRELLLTRPTVHRVLTTLSGRTRLLPILNGLQCLELASIDIRNALALAAEIASTLPRGWDVRTTLRNPAQ